MEFIAGLAIAVILWMIWQLYRAKQFNHFKQMIRKDIQQKVVQHIEQSLVENRSESFPNNDCHIMATTNYWCQYSARVLQYALQEELVTKQWLVDTGNHRHCQHLFHVEAPFLHHFMAKAEEE